MNSTSTAGIDTHIKKLTLYLILEGIAAAVWLLLIPKDSANAVLFGYSLKRLALLIPIFALLIAAAVFRVLYKRSAWIRSRFVSPEARLKTARWLVIVGFLTLISVWTFLFFYHLLALVDDIGAYFRLMPIMAQFFAFGLHLVLFVPLKLFPAKKKKGKPKISWRKPVFWSALALLLLLFALIELTGLGKDPLWVTIDSLAVPLLEGQIWYTVGVLVLIGVALFAWSATPSNESANPSNYRDALIFFGLWALAVILWMVLPLPKHNYFAPAVRPPTFLKYPFSDAEQYDYNSLYVLFGSIDNFVVSKPLYVSFLSVLHFIGGFDYRAIVFLQTLMLAFFPGVGYLIGKEIHSRIAGIGIGILIILREMLGIQASTIANVSNSKLLLSEMPAALLTALIVLVLVRWFKEPKKKISYRIFIAAGLTAMLNLMRIQTLTLIPVMVIIVIARYWGNWKKALLGTGILVLTVGVILTPILIRNQSITGVFWLDNPSSSQFLYRRIAVGTDVDAVSGAAETSSEMLGRNFSVIFSALTKNFSEMAGFITDHFLRSVISTVLIFPVRLGNGLPWIEFFKMGEPFWAEVYAVPNIWNLLGLLVNLTIIALGFARLWKRGPFVPLILIALFSVYNLSSAITRLSGWRFIQPVDWFIYLFFMVGTVEVIAWLMGRCMGEETADHFARWGSQALNEKLWLSGTQKAIISGVVFLLASSFIPLRELALPASYPQFDKKAACQEIADYVALSEYSQLTDQVLGVCIKEETAVYKGYGFYPRFFKEGEGIYDRETDPFFGQQAFSRLVFRIAGQENGKIFIRTENTQIGFRDGDLVYALVSGSNSEGADVVVFPTADFQVAIDPVRLKSAAEDMIN